MPHIASKDGTVIAFDRKGQGPALILVTGATVTRAFYEGLAMILAPHFTVFFYDRRGRGESGDTAPYAVQREVEDIEALINRAGGSAFVFGHSTGSVLALEAARLLSPQVTKLAIYEPPFIIDDSLPPVPPDYVARLTWLISSDRRGGAIEYYLKSVGTPVELIVQLRQSPMWSGIEALAHTVAYDGLLMADTLRGNPSSLGKWASITAPTLVMDGTVFVGSPERHGYLRAGANELARILPHAQRRTFEGQDHNPDNNVLALALKEFFLE